MSIGLGLTTLIPLFVYLFFIVIVVLTLFWRAEWGLYFLIVVIPLQNLMDSMHQYPLGKDIVDILILVIIIGGFFQQAYDKQDISPSPNLNSTSDINFILHFHYILYVI